MVSGVIRRKLSNPFLLRSVEATALALCPWPEVLCTLVTVSNAPPPEVLTGHLTFAQGHLIPDEPEFDTGFWGYMLGAL